MSNIVLLNDNSHALVTCQAVKDICKDLMGHFDLKYFRFLRVYKDGSRISLSTDPNWTKFFYEHSFHTIAWFDCFHIDKYTNSKHIWDTKALTDDNIVGTNARLHFNMHHGLSIIKKFKDYYECFDFTTSKCNSSINYIYLSYPEIFEKFIYYFREKANKLIKSAKNDKIFIPNNIGHEVEENNKKIKDMLTELNDKMTIKKYYIDDNIYLTISEIKIIPHLRQGLSAKIIAKMIGLSHRTVEKHIDNIRQKLSCQNVGALIRKLNVEYIDLPAREFVGEPIKRSQWEQTKNLA